MFSGRIMIKIPNTLSMRLTLWYALIFIGFLVFALLIAYIAVDSKLNLDIDEDLKEDVVEFNYFFVEGGLERIIQEIEEETTTESMDGEFIRLLSTNGEVVYSSNLSEWGGLGADELLISQLDFSENDPVFQTVKLGGQEYGTRIVYGKVAQNFVLQVGQSLEQKEELMSLLLTLLASMFLLAIPFASVTSWLVVKKAVSGINEVSCAAIDIRMGEFDRNVSVKTHSDEIQRLVDTFNAMANRIRSLVSEMRAVIDNIAHDLRSPLARIRAISEASLYSADSPQVYRAAAADTIVECDRLIKLVNTTLDVAEVEADVSRSDRDEINASELVEDACELFRPAAEEKKIALHCTILIKQKIIGCRQNLQRMIANLLDNAIKYTPEGGEVSVQLDGDEQKTCICISDSGVGIPLSDQERVFDRFYRCDQSRQQDGCGLGLSFARAVARAHGGDITLVSMPSESSTFTITLANS